MARKIWIALLIVIGVGLIGLTWYMVKVKDEIPVVDTIIVRPDTLDQEIVTTGNIVANARQELYALTTGKVAKVHVREGDLVQAGQLVLEMDTSLFDVQIEQAEAAVEAAQANLRLAQEKRDIALLSSETDFAINELSNLSVESAGNQSSIPTVEIFMSQPASPPTPEVSSQLPVIPAFSPSSTPFGPFSGMPSPTSSPVIPSPETLPEMPREGLEWTEQSAELFRQSQLEQIQPFEQQSTQFLQQFPPYHAQQFSRSDISSAKDADLSAEQQALVNQAEIGIKQAQAALKQAQAALKAAKLQREQLLLKSAISGTVTLVNAKEGTQVTMQTPLIVISDLSKLGVKASLNELDGSKVKPGQEVIISSATLGSKTLKGVVEKVGLEAQNSNSYSNTGNRVVNIEVSLDETAEELKPGFSVDLKIVLASKQGVLAVPYEALFQEGRKTYVYTVSEGKLVKTEVIPGAENETKQEILQGLKEGDRVVTSPLPSFYEGMRITYKDIEN